MLYNLGVRKIDYIETVIYITRMYVIRFLLQIFNQSIVNFDYERVHGYYKKSNNSHFSVSKKIVSKEISIGFEEVSKTLVYTPSTKHREMQWLGLPSRQKINWGSNLDHSTLHPVENNV